MSRSSCHIGSWWAILQNATGCNCGESHGADDKDCRIKRLPLPHCRLGVRATDRPRNWMPKRARDALWAPQFLKSRDRQKPKSSEPWKWDG